jgi:hypothetical protein
MVLTTESSLRKEKVGKYQVQITFAGFAVGSQPGV